jgi:hypothetical protein
MAMNPNLWLRLAWLVRAIQTFSEECFGMKKREQNKGFTMLLSVLLIMAGRERSGVICQRVAFGARRRFRRLIQ